MSDNGGVYCPGGPTARTRKIVYEPGTEFEGLWLRAGGLTVDEWLNMTIADSVDLFCQRLIEWNWVDDNGTPVPPTRAGVGGLDAQQVRTLVADWVTRCGALVPLGRPRPALVDETGIPMEV